MGAVVMFKKSVIPKQAAEIKPEKPERSFGFKEQQLINQLAYNPKDVSVYKKLGWLYLGADKSYQAKQAFKIAIKLGSKDRTIEAKLVDMEERIKPISTPIMITRKTKASRSSKFKTRPPLKIKRSL
jgi:hypothetical protein